MECIPSFLRVLGECRSEELDDESLSNLSRQALSDIQQELPHYMGDVKLEHWVYSRCCLTHTRFRQSHPSPRYLLPMPDKARAPAESNGVSAPKANGTGNGHSSNVKEFLKSISIDSPGYVSFVILPRKQPLEKWFNQIIKRTFDIVFSLFMIVCIFSWLFPIIALLVKLSSPGPIFFKQMRSGKDNKSFWCWKFRSMRVNVDADSIQATKNDDRITPVGMILRKTNMDELPQFFNVLRGDMSVVGPRPHMLKHTEHYSRIIDEYMARHFIKPGITGFAQINGYRGETQDPLLMKKRVQCDVWYIENWSFFHDLKIIAMTTITMILGDDNAC